MNSYVLRRKNVAIVMNLGKNPAEICIYAIIASSGQFIENNH